MDLRHFWLAENNDHLFCDSSSLFSAQIASGRFEVSRACKGGACFSPAQTFFRCFLWLDQLKHSFVLNLQTLLILMEKVVGRKGGCYPRFDSYKKGCGGLEGGVYFTNINVTPDERSGSEQHTKKYNFMKDIRRMESTVKILTILVSNMSAVLGYAKFFFSLKEKNQEPAVIWHTILRCCYLETKHMYI